MPRRHVLRPTLSGRASAHQLGSRGRKFSISRNSTHAPAVSPKSLRHTQRPSSSRKLRGSKIRLAPKWLLRPIPIQQRGPECPPPDRQKTRKPGVSDGALIGPCAIFLPLFGQELLISAVRFGRSTNVGQNGLRAGSVFIGTGGFIVLQHTNGKFD